MDRQSLASYTAGTINARFINKPMRFQGKITSWKDDQGFGFITPNGGGERVFVHIKAFAGTRRRPAGNDIVTYELRVDPKRGPRAVKVAFAGRQAAKPRAAGTSSGPLVFAGVFLLFVSGAAFAGRLSPVAAAWYLGASVIAFLAYAHDKSAAQGDRWRTRESTLHVLALAGGWPGALLAQRVLRHKSSKKSFRLVFWITVFFNCAVLSVGMSPAASHALLSFLIN